MHAYLPTDFSTLEQRRVYVGVTFLRIQNPEEAGKVAGRDILCLNCQNVGRGPGATDHTTVIGSVRAGRRWCAAKEYNDPAINLRLSEVDVPRPRGRAHSARSVSPLALRVAHTHGAAKPPQPVDLLRLHCAKTKYPHTIGRPLHISGAPVELFWSPHRH